MEAIRGDLTIAEIISKYQVSKTAIHEWKRLILENGQGGDIGYQYLSNIFYYSEVQKKLASDIIHQLQDMGYKVATQLKPVTTFWKAEDYHQKYYNKNGQLPYCHSWKQIF